MNRSAGPAWHLTLQEYSGLGIYKLLLAAYPIYLLRETLPNWFQIPLYVFGAFLVIQRVWQFERWHHETPHIRGFLLQLALFIAELLIENFLVWTVSATDKRNLELQPALQDNVELAMISLAQSSPAFRWFILYPFCETLLFVFIAVALAFSAGWDQMPFSGFGIMARYFYGMTLTRIIRTVSFLSTVVPSPRPGCYHTRFPVPPPSDWWGFVRVGVLAMRGTGGCNDLVFSGHAITWAMTCLLFGTYHRLKWRRLRRVFMGILWGLLVHACLRDVINKQHYSVDMWLAVVMTAAAWRWSEWIYPPQQNLIWDLRDPAVVGEAAKGRKRPTKELLVIAVAVGFGIVMIFIAKA